MSDNTKIVQMTDDELMALWDMITSVARAAEIISLEDCQRLSHVIEMSHAIGPIMYPSEYLHGMRNLEEQRELLNGFTAFKRSIAKVKAMGRGQ